MKVALKINGLEWNVHSLISKNLPYQTIIEISVDDFDLNCSVLFRKRVEKVIFNKIYQQFGINLKSYSSFEEVLDENKTIIISQKDQPDILFENRINFIHYINEIQECFQIEQGFGSIKSYIEAMVFTRDHLIFTTEASAYSLYEIDKKRNTFDFMIYTPHISDKFVVINEIDLSESYSDLFSLFETKDSMLYKTFSKKISASLINFKTTAFNRYQFEIKTPANKKPALLLEANNLPTIFSFVKSMKDQILAEEIISNELSSMISKLYNFISEIDIKDIENFKEELIILHEMKLYFGDNFHASFKDYITKRIDSRYQFFSYFELSSKLRFKSSYEVITSAKIKTTDILARMLYLYQSLFAKALNVVLKEGDSNGYALYDISCFSSEDAKILIDSLQFKHQNHHNTPVDINAIFDLVFAIKQAKEDGFNEIIIVNNKEKK